MYAIAIVRYRKPLAEVDLILADHRAYLKELQGKGLLLASGPNQARSCGAILLRVPDQDAGRTLDAILAGDPFVKAGVAQYELIDWNPVIGLDALNKL